MQSSFNDDIYLPLQQAFQSGLSRDLNWRKTQLKQLQKLVTDNQKAINQALFNDLGKPVHENWLTESGFVLTDIKHTLRSLKKWSKPRAVSTPLVLQPGSSYILPEPKGVVLVIGAWNYPLQLCLSPVIAALAAGNMVVLKPSELASHTSALLAELLPKYLDNHAIKVVEGAAEQTSELLELPFDHIFYTGGERVGKIVMKAAAEHLTPVTLELGGKSPCIISSDCDMTTTAKRIVWNKWVNAGQTCVAPDYLLVEEAATEPLIDAIKTQLKAFYGDAAIDNKDYCRIINQTHLNRLTQYLTGQTVIYGGDVNEAGYMSPTLVLNPPEESPLMQEEIFGPILPIIIVSNTQQAIDFINRRPKPLALYMYSNNKGDVKKVITHTSSGSVCINDGMVFMANHHLPFGGVGTSGMGNYHGQYGFDTFSHLKSVMHRSFKFDVALRYAPYSKLKLWLVKKLM
ncbi:aldehyde dehydrogenase family protein [Neptunicella marina]|uniref:Aldehyde dehydrogenase n=1 Tax=Neptunicella marina TaxID=2125989 RepID=A0A8J6M453_9ALTE|nr:aldehyde dehydrogenase family protein [Neptunicella marina]MBC3765846.1 aldehyde dehydrogenase family protein [Neptunicella marina]